MATVHSQRNKGGPIISMVQAVKTNARLVRIGPFVSLVPMLGGLFIGGLVTPFSRVRFLTFIGPEPLSLLKE
jgi:hypothetical protein